MHAYSSHSPHGCRNKTAFTYWANRLSSSFPNTFTSSLISDRIQPMLPTHTIHNGRLGLHFSLIHWNPRAWTCPAYTALMLMVIWKRCGMFTLKASKTYQSWSHTTWALSQERTRRFSTMDVFTLRVKITLSPNWRLRLVWVRLRHRADGWNGDLWGSGEGPRLHALHLVWHLDSENEQWSLNVCFKSWFVDCLRDSMCMTDYMLKVNGASGIFALTSMQIWELYITLQRARADY